jgi:hypothetical protein
MSESLSRALNGYADEERRLSTAETTCEEAPPWASDTSWWLGGSVSA